ncbi:hypothetical protein VRK_35990 [Vibrio sp. MEBiC08052]|nr:hypothetical protein VRK_35990 [Vibrio sp. MEBiC08052]
MMKKLTLAIALTISSSVAFADTNNAQNHGSMNNGTNMNHRNMMNMDHMSDVGMPATGVKPNKVVHVLLSDDMKITFKKEINIAPNDVVQFVVMNTGKIDHEFTIGSEAEQLMHRDMMKEMNGQHMHDMGNAVTVEPGKAKQLMWHFHGEKNVEFACNIPGHAEAGMTKNITL